MNSEQQKQAIEWAIERLELCQDQASQSCECEECQQCGKMPDECTGTDCAKTCQCSSCDHCGNEAAITELRALLDAPVECRCKRYGKDNPHWPCPVHAAPGAQPHGDLLARFPEINFSNYGQQEVEALQAWAFEAHDHIKTVGLADQSCVLPPTGWSCARGAGHEGPCAAVLTYPPVPYDRKLPDDQRGEISQDDKVFRCGAAAKMALPERRDISSVSCNSALYEIYHGWNSCLDAIAKLNGAKS